MVRALHMHVWLSVSLERIHLEASENVSSDLRSIDDVHWMFQWQCTSVQQYNLRLLIAL